MISDRYGDSTVAYQGGARGLGIERVEELNQWLTGKLEPDVTFLLEVEPATAAGRGRRAGSLRARGRGAAARGREARMRSLPRVTPNATCGSMLRGLPRRFTRTSSRDCR